MAKKIRVLLVFALLTTASGPVPGIAGESGFESSCMIHIKTSVYPSDPLEQRGKARVYATLCTREGKPIFGQEIQLTASCGTFSCKPLDLEDTMAVDSSVESCTITDKAGKIMVYLVNIPFNNQGSVTVSCDYGSLSVKASCTFLISQYAVQKKAPKKVSTRRVSSLTPH
jgi:hypothetical protein